MQNFKELKVWEKAHQFTLKVYEVTRSFPKDEVYGLTSQLKRAAFSVPSNIAEGCGKHSKNEFAHYLNIALGSANEAGYFILLAKDLTYLAADKAELFSTQINEIKAMLIGLIRKIRE